MYGENPIFLGLDILQVSDSPKTLWCMLGPVVIHSLVLVSKAIQLQYVIGMQQVLLDLSFVFLAHIKAQSGLKYKPELGPLTQSHLILISS